MAKSHGNSLLYQVGASYKVNSPLSTLLLLGIGRIGLRDYGNIAGRSSSAFQGRVFEHDLQPRGMKSGPVRKARYALYRCGATAYGLVIGGMMPECLAKIFRSPGL
jgi:hypothetical protein